MSEEIKNNLAAFEQAKNFIDIHSVFLMASHAKTDGDDLGSMLAMLRALRDLNKDAAPMAIGGVPPSLRFLPSQNEVLEMVPEKEFDAVILFGCSDIGRPEIAQITNAALPILNIDHHADNKLFGVVNLVDKNKSSVAELVYDFFKYLKVPFNTEIAKCLLTGMLTDTGSFMHANTKSSTLAAAADLLKYGARIEKIYDSTYKSKDLNTLKAWAKAIENTRVDEDNQIAIAVLTEEDLAEIGPLPDDAFGGIVDTLNTIPNTKFSIFIRQQGAYIKGSVRSDERKNVDVSKLANMFGGGGHKLASGFRLEGRIVRDGKDGWKVI